MEASFQQIERSLKVLFQPGDTIELRCVGGRPINGFYRNQIKLANDAQQLNSTLSPPQNVYVCLNPVLPELYARRADVFAEARRGEAVKDQDINTRRWLLVDIDAKRPSGVSATDAQKKAAIELAKQVYVCLQESLGGDCLVCADSGNGGHILIHLPDVPADDESRWVCENFLRLLDKQFSTTEAKVDCTTFNAARICTLYATVKRKGSDIPEQPHRLSRLVHVPEPLQPTDWQTLAGLVDPYPGNQQPAQPSDDGSTRDIEQLLEQRQLEHNRDDNYQTASGEVATRWVLTVCPWDSAHNDNAAWVIQFPNGAIAAGCQHDGCSGKNWQALKQLWQLPDSSDGITAADIILPQPPQPQPELLIVSSLDVQPEPIAWLWQDRFVIGGINLCAGRGGIGKTYLLCDMVARITNQTMPAPNGQPLQHGRVLYSTGEDHIAKVLEPRMQQHAVDRSRLEYIKGLPAGPYIELLDVIVHCNLLRDALRQRPDTVALVLDPISSFQGGADSNKVSQVRQFTAVLTQLAEEFNIAVVGVHHFNKSKRDFAGDSISGSHAYRDAARSIWLFALDADDPTRRLMVCDKHNWAEQRPLGLAYRIESGRIRYEAEPLDMTCDELLSQVTERAVDVARAWLLTQLSAGPQPPMNLQIAAAADGIADRTLQRAKKSLGVVSQREGKNWIWSLPTEKDTA